MNRYVVVGPGAMGFYCLLGALHSQVDFETLEEISGSSAGALATLCFLLQVPLVKCLEVDVQSIIRPSIRTFLKEYGFISRKKVLSFLIEFFGRDYTFQELYEHTGKIFHIAVCSLTYNKVIYVSVKNSPSSSVLETLLTSISIPLLFVPQVVGGQDVLVDGSVYEFLPGGPFIGSEDSVLEISLDSASEVQITKNKGVLFYFLKVLRSLMGLRRTYYFPNKKLVKFGPDECFNFAMTQDRKLEVYKIGLSL